jgi:hypothetical protein
MIDKKLGYYSCGDQIFDSKIKACLHSVKISMPITWHFNDAEFKSFNWAEEPSETLDELYNLRVKQLREKYDYLMLSYSGGSDSHNILMAFVRQGIHLDEIIVNTMEKGSKNFTSLDPTNKNSSNAGAEFDLQTLPRLKEIEKIIPKTKITIVDLTDHLFSSLEKIGDASWILDKKEQVNIAGATRFNYIHFNEIRKNFDKNKTIALIVGLEKPRTWIKDGMFYMGLNDRAANIITVAEHIRDYTNSSVEFFYWSPDALKIIAKQCHTIKKWLEAFPENQKLWDMKLMNIPFSQMFRMVHERILRTLIYTTWDNNWYQADKAVKDWYSEFDMWFYEGHKDTKAYMIWQEGLHYLETNLTPYITKNKEQMSDGMVNYYHWYKIGSMKNDKI